MAKIPFSIDYKPQIESGEYKVILENGHSGRVLAWDLPGDFPIAIADVDDTCVWVGTYNNKGWCGIGKSHNCLFVATPEPELTEFEKVLNDIIWSIGMGEVVYNNDAIKETAAKLLNLARKQLVEEQYTSDPRKTDLYKLGKTEALKDLPRWKVLTLKQITPFLGCRNEDELFYKGRVIALSELEKLPGFKED